MHFFCTSSFAAERSVEVVHECCLACPPILRRAAGGQEVGARHEVDIFHVFTYS